MDTRHFLKPLKPRLRSSRDFSHHKSFPILGAVVLPDELFKLPSAIANQGNKPSCTAAASVTCRNIMNGKVYDEGGQWALEFQYAGATTDGYPLDVPAKVGKDVGFSITGQNGGFDKVGGYFWKSSNSGLDIFDTIKNTIFQNYQRTGKVIPFQVGLNWFSSFENSGNGSGIVPHIFENLLGGHDTSIVGWKKINGIDYLINANSWGTSHGLNGYFYFDRFMANKCFTISQFYWLDAEDMPTDVFRLGIFAAILQNIKVIFQLLIQIKNQPKPVPTPEPVIPPDQSNPPIAPNLPIQPTMPITNGDPTRFAISNTAIANGVEPELAMAVASCEGGFIPNTNLLNPKARNYNRDKNGSLLSTDRGAFQYNDKVFPLITDAMADDPATACKIFCQEVKAGLLKVVWQFSMPKWSKMLSPAIKTKYNIA